MTSPSAVPNFPQFTAVDHLASRILNGARQRRESFDPNNPEHLESYRKFLTTGNWGAVQFYAEGTWVTVPETVSRKFALHVLAEKLGAIPELKKEAS